MMVSRTPGHGSLGPLLLALAAALPSCAQAPQRGEEGADPSKREVLLEGAAAGWRAALVHDNDGVGIWTCEAIQVFPQYGTPEAIGLDDKGRCWVLVHYSGKWTPMQVVDDGLWLGGLDQADLDPRHPGPELYVGGRLGRLYAVRGHRNGVLDAQFLAETGGLEIHTLLSADWRGRGEELLVFTRPGRAFLAYYDESGDFQLEDLGEMPGRMRDAQVLPARGGGPRLASVCRDGALRVCEFVDGVPEWTEVHRLGVGLGRLAIRQDADGAGVVLYSTVDDGRVFRHEEATDGSWSHEAIYRGPMGPRGVAVGRFDPDPEVETVAVFGYSSKVELLRRGAEGWAVETLFTDRDKGHWLAAGEFDGRNDTDELLFSGYGARMVMLARDPTQGDGAAVRRD